MRRRKIKKLKVSLLIRDLKTKQMQEKLMGFEEIRRLKDEAKESQVRKQLDSVSEASPETNQTEQSKRSLWDLKRSGG